MTITSGCVLEPCDNNLHDAMFEECARDAGSGISWNDVEEYGEPVGWLRPGDAFVTVLADQFGQKFRTFTGVVVGIREGSVSVQIERTWQNEVITWAREAKVIALPSTGTGA